MGKGREDPALPFDGVDLGPHLGPGGRTQITPRGLQIVVSGKGLNGAQIDAIAEQGG